MLFTDLFDECMNPLWDKIESVPEFSVLRDTRQSLVWHKEGNVLEHTKRVVNEMKKYLDSKKIHHKSTYYLVMMCAALCHDLGKATTTYWNEEKQDWSCKHHGLVGERITRKLFYDDVLIYRELVCYMVRWHMELHMILDNEEKINDKMKFMSNGMVSIKNMLILNACDSLGSVNDIETREFLQNRLDRIKAIASELGIYDKVYSNYREIDNNAFTIYMMLGLPGSGKNYYIEHNAILSKLPSLSRDDIRTEIGLKGEKPQGNKEQENKVTEIFNNRMMEYCKNKQSFVINNTNLRKCYRDEMLKSVKEYNPQIVYIYVEPKSIETNYKRRKGLMPLNVIDRMLSNMDFPHLSECDMLLIDDGILNVDAIPSFLNGFMR